MIFSFHQIFKDALLLDVVYKAKKLEYDLAGHISRLEDNRLKKAFREWCLANQKRRSVRQFVRLRNKLTEIQRIRKISNKVE